MRSSQCSAWQVKGLFFTKKKGKQSSIRSRNSLKQLDLTVHKWKAKHQTKVKTITKRLKPHPNSLFCKILTYVLRCYQHNTLFFWRFQGWTPPLIFSSFVCLSVQLRRLSILNQPHLCSKKKKEKRKSPKAQYLLSSLIPLTIDEQIRYLLASSNSKNIWEFFALLILNINYLFPRISHHLYL